MSLPMLFGGAECGPSNPLQGLSKRFDQDRGLQQDHFGISKAGSSKDVFRTQPSPAGPDADAARFFSPSTPSLATQGVSTAFDVSAMGTALPPVSIQPPQLQAPALVPGVASGWAVDFMNMGANGEVVQQPKPQVMGGPSQSQMEQNGSVGMVHTPSLMQNWNPLRFGAHGIVSQMPIQQPQQQPFDQISWDKEFTAREVHLATSTAEQTTVDAQPQGAQKAPFEGDELARTAGLLLENLKHETNPKFQKSQFMELMKQLRDGEMVVDGNQVVENDGRMGQLNAADVKGKGKEKAHIPSDPSSSLDSWDMLARGFPPTPSFFQDLLDRERQHRQGDANDAHFQQENADYITYWNEFHTKTMPPNAVPTTQQKEWDTLQEDWDRFEATSSGIKSLNVYQFREDNPYMLGDSSRTRHHAMHGEMLVLESILELEAAVQRDMTNAKAWYELGIKHQENEREYKALQALERAVELDPDHLPSWLALAISYTNDNNRERTYDTVAEWVKRIGRHSKAGAGSFDAAATANMNTNEKYTRLVNRLIDMARSDTNGEIDADIQIALAVLLSTNEEYGKARDCFKTALAVRPDDWLLYNRVGATMANSGNAVEALQYYYRALELNPGYIRARFNLGISCINLSRYEEAAHHILDALVLQDSDGIKDVGGGHEKRGVTSAALWDSLKTTCLQLRRADLAGLCDSRNLERLVTEFRVDSAA